MSAHKAAKRSAAGGASQGASRGASQMAARIEARKAVHARRRGLVVAALTLATLLGGAAGIGGLPVGTAVAHADTASPSQGPLLAPTNDDALLNLLIEDGVDYTTSTSADDASSYSDPDSTLVIDSDETDLSADEISELAAGPWGRVIILGDDPAVLAAFAPGVTTAAPVSGPLNTSAPVSPDCSQPDAIAAGGVLMPTTAMSYDLPKDADDAGTTPTDGASATSTQQPQITDLRGCYPIGAAPTLVSVQSNATGGDVILLGWTDFIENQYLAQQGDAALGLRLFGAHGTLVWLATEFTDDENLNGCQGVACDGGGSGTGGSSGGAGGGGGIGGGSGGGGSGQGNGQGAQPPTVVSLIPHWIWWMLLQLVVAALALAYWRSRRLGRLVGENLPVRVRAAETVEGHANLYRRASAHGRAAGLLRSATARRIAPLLGMPAGPAGRSPESLVAPLAERLGRPAEQVRTILAGGAPMTEAELVRLTDQLDLLEQEVRSP